MTRTALRLVAANEDEAALKRIFARALLRQPHKPQDAARRVFPGPANGPRAAQAAQHWPTDPDVLAMVDAMTTDDGLPSREEVAWEIWAIGMNEEAADRDRLSAFKLYVEAMGFVKPTAPTGDDIMGQMLAKIEQNGRPKPPGTE